MRIRCWQPAAAVAPTGWLGDLRRYTSAALLRCSIYLFKTRV